MWRLAAAELDGYRRAYGLDYPWPAKHVRGRVARDGRPGVPAIPLAGERADGAGQQRERGGRGEHAHRRGDRGRRPALAAGQRHRVDPERLLGAEPRRQAPGHRRDWQTARAALERLAGWDRHREDRDLRHLDRNRSGRSLGRTERVGR